ncbi:hypothetical protein AMTR_s00071p00164080 [Amborella trichopoda]|uniref:Amino acid transporter transmembrane domain-containing protein n=1 Tax=Amborella trichopoda TaxID=13333 RepID=U5DBZ1_AMBTC|nr:hypothetical protein AMTR_s00071p00164080 [Amborella trichopoda]
MIPTYNAYSYGTVWTAAAHVITAIIGTGVLGLAWSVSQLGWIVGPLFLVGFGFVTYYTSTLQADCYRYPDPVTGKRNYTYREAVRAFLGSRSLVMCSIAQCAILWGIMIGYTIIAATSMIAVKKSNCFHKNGHNASCKTSENVFMVTYGLFQIVLSQLPSMHKLAVTSVVAAIMSFGYSGIGLSLSAAKLVSNGVIKGSIGGNSLGNRESSLASNVWNSFQALGNIAFAYVFAHVLTEIQDTLRSHPPENKVMKRATLYGIVVTSVFYMSLGCVGYAAFGSKTPGNILTGFGFYEPFWLVDIGNICVVVHLLGAYQVFAQPIFAAIEDRVSSKWPSNFLLQARYEVKLPCSTQTSWRVTLFSLIMRTTIVVMTTLVAILVPLFNSVVGLLGAMAFWPLTIYFPVSMHIVQANVTRGSMKWFLLQCLVGASLIVSVIAGIGSLVDITKSLKHSKPFQAKY